MFHDSLFFLAMFTLHFTMECFNRCFHMNNHKDQVSHLRYIFFDEIVNKKNFEIFFSFCCALCGRYQDIRHLLQNQSLPRNVMAIKNHKLYHKSFKQQALLHDTVLNKYYYYFFLHGNVNFLILKKYYKTKF